MPLHKNFKSWRQFQLTTELKIFKIVLLRKYSPLIFFQKLFPSKSTEIIRAANILNLKSTILHRRRHYAIAMSVKKLSYFCLIECFVYAAIHLGIKIFLEIYIFLQLLIVKLTKCLTLFIYFPLENNRNIKSWSWWQVHKKDAVLLQKSLNIMKYLYHGICRSNTFLVF